MLTRRRRRLRSSRPKDILNGAARHSRLRRVFSKNGGYREVKILNNKLVEQNNAVFARFRKDLEEFIPEVSNPNRLNGVISQLFELIFTYSGALITQIEFLEALLEKERGF